MTKEVTGSDAPINMKPVTKERLKQYTALLQEIDDQIERLARMAASLESPAGMKMDGMPHSNFAVDRMAIAVARKDELERIIIQSVERERKEAKELEEAVQLLHSPTERMLIRLRYFDNLEWPEVCETLFGKSEDYDEKLDGYMRRTFRIHGRALVNLTEATKEDETKKSGTREKGQKARFRQPSDTPAKESE